MKFQPDTLAGVNSITRHDSGRVWVGATPYVRSVLVPWVGEVRAWAPQDFGQLDAAAFEAIVALQPELVIFGSGARIRFAPPALMRALMERRIGIETMDTAAACRTYNVLVNEQRSVVAALLLEGPPAAA
ncbi:conserved hypothetical protein [Rubrivivax sp. A210]|uniref:Mth938-like domain-containing protein n=1 Tax=Rubrivivax sp. A210 TaxID=2772301 RepID=UPI00191AB9D6|nr:Mth938-like domain-containing protein [Rubrivivax sp. A210]CAD5373694.1 conserved hypothetical protein [Rubrivivax sp. A210]